MLSRRSFVRSLCATLPVFPLEQISHVDVITHDAGLSALLTTLIVTLASGGAAGIALAIVFSL